MRVLPIIAQLASNPLVVTRESLGTILDSDTGMIEDVAASLPRYETVAQASLVTVTDRGAYCPFAVDAVRNVLLIGKDDPSAATKLYARSQVDGTGDALLVNTAAAEGQPGYDAAIAAFRAEDGLTKWIYACSATSLGTYLLSYSRDLGYDGVKVLAAIFRSTQGGVAGTWVRVLDSVKGGPASMQDLHVSGTRVVFGTYIGGKVANTSIYLSEDDGVTWTEIWNQTAIIQHCHTAFFDPALTERIWAQFDEANYAKLVRLDRSGGTWTYTDILSGAADHDLIFTGCVPTMVGSEVFIGGSNNLAFDPATGYWRYWLTVPTPTEGVNTGYAYWEEARRSLVAARPVVLDGVLFVPMTTFGTDYKAGWDAGVYASPDDGRHWVRLYWVGTTHGVTHLVGPWRGLVWGMQRSTANVDMMFSFRSPDVSLVSALRLEGGVTNQFTLDGSTFTNVVSPPHKSTKTESGWTVGDGSVASLNDASILGDGVTPAGCYGFFAAQASIHETSNNYPYGGVKSPTKNITAGQYVTCSVFVKAMSPWPGNRQVMAAFWGTATIAVSGNSGLDYYSAAVRPPINEWMELRIEGRCSANGTVGVQITTYTPDITCTFNVGAKTVTPASGVWANGSRVSFRPLSGKAIPVGLTRGTTYYIVNSDGATFQVSTTLGGSVVDPVDAGTGTWVYSLDSWTFRWDAAMIVIDAANWYAGSFQPGGTPRTIEYADAVLTGLPASGWTVGVEWRPGSGYKEYAADLSILSIGDGTHWMDLTWDASEAKFTLTDDGAHTASQTSAMKWRHFDSLGLVLVSDGTDTWLYVVDSTNGVQTALKCTAVNVGTPTALRLGSNHDASLPSCGSCLNVWRQARLLSSNEVADAMGLVGFDVNVGVRDMALCREWGWRVD